MPKILYIVLKIVKGLNLDFAVCEPEDYKCHMTKVVITTESESVGIAKNRLVLVDEQSDEVSISMEIMMRYYRIVLPNELIIGIDPGLHTGLTVVGDGNVLYTKTLTSPIDTFNLASRISDIASNSYPSSQFLFRLGSGSKLYSTLFLRGLSKNTNGPPLEMVDEKYTTLPGGYETDQTSAVLIAARSGRKPGKGDYLIEPKTGYIRALQHLFDWLTGKQNSLSIDTARAILLDECSLEDALEKI
jgi:hypothetical protein